MDTTGNRRLHLADSGDKYDFPIFTGKPQVFAIAAVPRSGTTLLGKTLRASEVAGAPMEYFNQRIMADFHRRWGEMSVEALRDRLLQVRTSPNGMFGFNVQWDQFLRQFGRNNCPDFRHLLVPSKIIFMRRVDQVRQAISWARAAQTDQWSSEMALRHEPRYSRRLIVDCISNILQIETLWRQYFAVKRITPLDLTYEALAEDFDGTFRRVTDFLGVAIDRVPEPPTQRLYDELSEEWLQRFMADQQHHSPSSDHDHAGPARISRSTSIESQS
jgi:LPS sulfotransferase NodH